MKRQIQFISIFLYLFLASFARASEMQCLSLFSFQNEQIKIWQLFDGGSHGEATRMRDELEDRMKTSEIDLVLNEYNTKQMAIKVMLKNGITGIWKPKLKFDSQGHIVTGDKYYLSGDGEVAAYIIDKELGYNRVAVTVDKTFNGIDGSLQLFVDGADTAVKESYPDTLSFFDSLIQNYDRHRSNYLVVDGRVIAIDNSFAFNTPPAETFKKGSEVICVLLSWMAIS